MTTYIIVFRAYLLIVIKLIVTGTIHIEDFISSVHNSVIIDWGIII